MTQSELSLKKATELVKAFREKCWLINWYSECEPEELANDIAIAFDEQSAEVEKWKAKYIEARQSGYKEGLEEATENHHSELSAPRITIEEFYSAGGPNHEIGTAKLLDEAVSVPPESWRYAELAAKNNNAIIDLMKQVKELEERCAILTEALESISKTRSKSCVRKGCTCVFDYADLALAKAGVKK